MITANDPQPSTTKITQYHYRRRDNFACTNHLWVSRVKNHYTCGGARRIFQFAEQPKDDEDGRYGLNASQTCTSAADLTVEVYFTDNEG